jgi:hypothetical protein
MKKLLSRLYYTFVKVRCPKCNDLIGECDLCKGVGLLKKQIADQYVGRYDPGSVHMYHVFGHHPEDKVVCPCRIAGRRGYAADGNICTICLGKGEVKLKNSGLKVCDLCRPCSGKPCEKCEGVGLVAV